MAGKGDSYRKVDPIKWARNYDRVFRRVCAFCQHSRLNSTHCPDCLNNDGDHTRWEARK